MNVIGTLDGRPRPDCQEWQSQDGLGRPIRFEADPWHPGLRPSGGADPAGGGGVVFVTDGTACTEA